MLDDELQQAGENRKSLLDTLSFAQDSWGSLCETMRGLDPSNGGVWDDSCGQEIAQNHLQPMQEHTNAATAALEKQTEALGEMTQSTAATQDHLQEAQDQISEMLRAVESGHSQNASTAGLCEQSRNAAANARWNAQECAQLIEDAGKAGAAA